MRILLDVKDNRASYVLQILKSMKFVKTKTLTEKKAQFLEEL